MSKDLTPEQNPSPAQLLARRIQPPEFRARSAVLADVIVETFDDATIRSRGEGLSIIWGQCPSPFGRAWLAASHGALIKLGYAPEGRDEDPLTELGNHWPRAEYVHDERQAKAWGETVFAVKPGQWKDLRICLHGTAFQVNVWRALLRIEPGRVTTYGAIAAAIGHPGAFRAVGTAVGANPLAWVIPCHRVVPGNGKIGNYRSGPARKRAMLAWEFERFS